MFAEQRIRVFVQRGPIEPSQRPLVLGEVRGDPVDDHADSGVVQPVDQEPEVIRVPVPGRRREVGRDLIAP